MTLWSIRIDKGRRIPLADIAFLKIDTRSDNTDFDLHLHSGEIVSLTGARVSSTARTKVVFENCGVEVQQLQAFSRYPMRSQYQTSVSANIEHRPTTPSPIHGLLSLAPIVP